MHAYKAVIGRIETKQKKKHPLVEGNQLYRQYESLTSTGFGFRTAKKMLRTSLVLIVPKSISLFSPPCAENCEQKKEINY